MWADTPLREQELNGVCNSGGPEEVDAKRPETRSRCKAAWKPVHPAREATTTPTSLGATDACPRVCAHMAYAVVRAPFQITTAENTSSRSGFEARAPRNLIKKWIKRYWLKMMRRRTMGGEGDQDSAVELETGRVRVHVGRLASNLS